MGWLIECTNSGCPKKTLARDIVALIKNHTNNAGWLKCPCGASGYIKKEYRLQEQGYIWKPFLRGVLSLGSQDSTYQPFVFLVSYEPTGPVTDVWLSYYKDLRVVMPLRGTQKP